MFDVAAIGAGIRFPTLAVLNVAHSGAAHIDRRSARALWVQILAVRAAYVALTKPPRLI